MFFIDWEQNKKQDKKWEQNKKTTKNKTNIETERQKHTPWKQKQQKKTNNQKWKQLGFQKGDVRKVCFKEKKQTLGKEKARKKN